MKRILGWIKPNPKVLSIQQLELPANGQLNPRRHRRCNPVYEESWAPPGRNRSSFLLYSPLFAPSATYIFITSSFLHNRRLKISYLWTSRNCWYQQTGPAQFGQNHPPSSFSPNQANSNIYNSSINKISSTSYSEIKFHQLKTIIRLALLKKSLCIGY